MARIATRAVLEESASYAPEQVLALQRTAGNAAVARLLNASEPPQSRLAPAATGGLTPAAGSSSLASGSSPVDALRRAVVARTADRVRLAREAAVVDEGTGSRDGGDGGPTPGDANGDHLTSPRFVGEPLLEACFENTARMGVGDRDDETFSPVSKVQQALFDLGYDLGGGFDNGVDGRYGNKTAAAVRLFKDHEQLGFGDFGDVGPGTMHRLNELFPGEQPVCPVGPDEPIFADAASSDTDFSAFALTSAPGISPTQAKSIPGLTCQIKPIKPPVIPPVTKAPHKLDDIPKATRAKLRVATGVISRDEVDQAYIPFHGTVKDVATVTGIVFGDGVPGDKDTKEGLTRVGRKLLDAKDSKTGNEAFRFNMTMNVMIHRAVFTPPTKGAKQQTIDGGLFRYTRLNMGTAKAPDQLVLVERLSSAETSLFDEQQLFIEWRKLTGAFTDQVERDDFKKHFGKFGWTCSDLQGDELPMIIRALDQIRDSAKAKAKGVKWFRSPPRAVAQANEDGHYDPNDNTITLRNTAFASSAERMGTYARGQFVVGHELGHALSNLDKGAKAGFDKAARGTEPLTDYGATATEENFAECFSMFSSLPSELQSLRPSIFDFFDKRYP